MYQTLIFIGIAFPTLWTACQSPRQSSGEGLNADKVKVEINTEQMVRIIHTNAGQSETTELTGRVADEIADLWRKILTEAEVVREELEEKDFQYLQQQEDGTEWIFVPAAPTASQTAPIHRGMIFRSGKYAFLPKDEEAYFFISSGPGDQYLANPFRSVGSAELLARLFDLAANKID